MAYVKLTDRTVQSLKTSQQQEDFYDNTFNSGGSFGVRVSRAGRKVFFVFYRAQGKKKRFNLGAYPMLSLADARKKAIRAMADIEEGSDPAKEKQEKRTAETFSELVEIYFKYHGNKLAASTQKDFRTMLKRDVIPITNENSRFLKASCGHL